MRGKATTAATAARDPSGVALMISFVASAATALLVLSRDAAWHEVAARPGAFAIFAVLALVLQTLSIEVYGRGAVSVSGIGMLAVGFTFGAGAAAATAVLVAVVHALRYRVMLHRAVFNASTFVLAAGAGAAAYHALVGAHSSALARLGPAFVGGAVFWAVNIALLSVAMAVAEETSALAVWLERFRWLTPHYLAFGPLALASSLAYERVGVTGLIAFNLPPAILILSVGQYLRRTKQAVEDVRRANDELQRANDDLRELFEFAGGLAARAHDRRALVEYAEGALGTLAGAPAQVLDEHADEGDALVAAGDVVGSVRFADDDTFDRERWGRLRDALLPQLATAVESAGLVDQVRRTHLATIAALSRSMEAKDNYTGGHTERVSAVAVALARRLGYSGLDLDAIEVGALLHDIGKIGIPERILHKPGPLDEEEWRVMKEHPVISEYILADADLPPIVLQIARSSHERIDGNGYPDGIGGEEIPLPARIVLVADAFDALTSDRPYRSGRHVRAALEELRKEGGTQFCPRVLAALETLFREEPQLLAGGAVLRPLAVA